MGTAVAVNHKKKTAFVDKKAALKVLEKAEKIKKLEEGFVKTGTIVHGGGAGDKLAAGGSSATYSPVVTRHAFAGATRSTRMQSLRRCSR